MNTFHAVGDINGDGRLDIVVSGRSGRMVWLENRGDELPWPEHLVDDGLAGIECGGSVVDLTGNGLGDVLVGGGGGNDEIWWWENPGPEGGKWARRTILKTGCSQFHDTLIGDALSNGVRTLVFTNQQAPGGTTVYCVPLPDNPRATPWPNVEIVATELSEELAGPNDFRKMQPEEGIAIGDVDGDGQNEIVCGNHWFKKEGGTWRKHRFSAGYVTTKIAIADLDGDGRNEIVLSEGDPCIYGKSQGGKAAWFKRPDDPRQLWKEHVLEDGLLDAHTLAVGDLRYCGRLDIVVGEIGVCNRERSYRKRPPRILVFENDGKGEFNRRIVDDGTGIHDGVLADMRGDGTLDLVGKPLHGSERWSVHVYRNTLRRQA
ncbi:MAG TPA: VCBS repeat-containing protein [Candidatus Brocadiia bacterium]|nr:VCBS repeat-containing protein [Candidatus Brocadiia bacterium]